MPNDTPIKYTVPVEKLSDLVVTIFEKNGLTTEDAELMAANLLDANIRGMHSHGVLRVENYVKRIQCGAAKVNAELKVLHETPFSATLDGGHGLGAVIGSKAADLCRKKAEEIGIACVTVRNSNHYGTSAYYCERMAKDDMIAFSCSNVEPLMAPPGATKVAIGNNPFAMVAPRGDRHDYIVSDMATSQVALGKILNYRLNNEKLPGEWAIDENGKPTNDPFAAKFLMPMGLHKGYGIAVLLEILCSVLAGGPIGTEINSMYGDVEKPNNLSHFFMCMKVSAFQDIADYRKNLDKFVDYLQSIPNAGGGHIVVPGELEAASRAKTLKNGVEITEALAKELLGMAYDDFSGDIRAYLG